MNELAKGVRSKSDLTKRFKESIATLNNDTKFIVYS